MSLTRFRSTSRQTPTMISSSNAPHPFACRRTFQQIILRLARWQWKYIYGMPQDYIDPTDRRISDTLRVWHVVLPSSTAMRSFRRTVSVLVTDWLTACEAFSGEAVAGSQRRRKKRHGRGKEFLGGAIRVCICSLWDDRKLYGNVTSVFSTERVAGFEWHNIDDTGTGYCARITGYLRSAFKRRDAHIFEQRNRWINWIWVSI